MISLSLTQTAEYALRAMSSLALRTGEEPLRANQLAERTGVPLAYLWKIMRRLVDAGLVVSSKGHGGGFRLARPAEAITYMDILEVTGYDAKADVCVFGWGQCRSEKPCPMHSTWSRMNETFVAWARSANLAVLVPPGAAVAQTQDAKAKGSKRKGSKSKGSEGKGSERVKRPRGEAPAAI